MRAKIKAIGIKKYFPVSEKILKLNRGERTTLVKAVDGVDIEIFEGETLALVGESGCGKSTLGKILIKLIEPDEGKIFFNDNEITILSKNQMRFLRRKMQMIFQDPFTVFNPIYKIGNQIFEAVKFHKVVEPDQIFDYVSELMRVVGLHPEMLDKYPHQLSGGQLQRCAIVRAISLKPEFLICDEIVSALDVSIQVQIIELLKVLKKEFNLTLLFITHDIGIVKQIADRVAVMLSGKIVEIGKTEKVLNEPENPYTRKLISSVLKISTKT